MSRPTIRPDSRNSKLLQTLLDATRLVERGLRLDELTSAYSRRHGPVDSKLVSSSLNTLWKRGLVVKAGGRFGQTLWVHVDAQYQGQDDSDPADAICDVVADTARSTGKALTTGEVHEALLKRGITDLSVDQVRTKLRSLAYSSPAKAARAHPDWKEPRVRLMDQTSSSGRRLLLWAPLEGECDTPQFVDRSDAIRFAIADAERRLACPVTKQEVRVWAAPAAAGEFGAAASHAADAVLDAGFAGAVNNVVTRGSKVPGGITIRAVRTPWTSRGNYPPRLSAVEGEGSYDAVSVVEDLAVFLKPADEVESIAALREAAEELSCRHSAKIATAREQLLAQQIRDLLGEDHTHIEGSVATAVSARRTLSEWLTAADLPPWKRQRREDELSSETAQLMALLDSAMLGSSMRPAGDRMPRGIGETEGRPLADFEDLALEATAIAESDAVHWQNQLAQARRVQGARSAGVAAAREPANHAWLDRPDAISCIARSCFLPELTAWVAGAEAVMGFVMRDPQWLRDYLEEVPSEDGSLRQHVTVALGLLGTPPPLSLACPVPSDPNDLGAYIVSVALGIDDPDERLRLAEEADLYAVGTAMETTDMALGRIEGGTRLAVLG